MIASLPGFRRRILVEPGLGRTCAAVEDDYHCMAVTLHHDGVRVTAVESVMERVPWTTCPGASAVLEQTFAAIALADVARRGLKQTNCTHLHDLAVLAAAHAADDAPLVYDILVSDPVDGLWHGEIRANGQVLLRLSHRGHVLVSPDDAAGASLFRLRDWIESLPENRKEAARLLQWGTILAHGRAIPMAQQSDASRIPPNCYTFQDERRHVARRVGAVRDFSADQAEPLGHYGAGRFSGRIA